MNNLRILFIILSVQCLIIYVLLPFLSHCLHPPWRAGFASKEFGEIHVCLFPGGVFPFSAIWLRGISWVREIFILLLIHSLVLISLIIVRLILYLIIIDRKGQALQFNWLFEKEAFILHSDDTFSVDFDKVKPLN